MQDGLAGWAHELDLTQGQLPFEAYSWDFPAKELTEEGAWLSICTREIFIYPSAAE
jgi:hypothetical protein